MRCFAQCEFLQRRDDRSDGLIFHLTASNTNTIKYLYLAVTLKNSKNTVLIQDHWVYIFNDIDVINVGLNRGRSYIVFLSGDIKALPNIKKD